MKTFHQYLLDNLEQTVMISLSYGDTIAEYSLWNWLHTINQFHLIRSDGSVGHIIHNGSIIENEDTSITHSSKFHPQNCVMNFYFGGYKP